MSTRDFGHFNIALFFSFLFLFSNCSSVKNTAVENKQCQLPTRKKPIKHINKAGWHDLNNICYPGLSLCK